MPCADHAPAARSSARQNIRATVGTLRAAIGGVTETKIEPIYQAWLSLPDTQRGEMEPDFKEIDTLACEGGVKAIIDEADWHDENLV